MSSAESRLSMNDGAAERRYMGGLLIKHLPSIGGRWLVLAISISMAMIATVAIAEEESKLEVHGFLTQAYATSNFVEGPLVDAFGSPTEGELLLGIPEDGTFDYRTMALQFRYRMSDQDIFVVQLSNEATGISPIDPFRDEIELDWAFYERRIGANSSVKVGRVQIPFGIFNEIRDVGTVLPFYRAPFSIYLEGSFTSETVDGIVAGHTIGAESDWPLDIDVYFGEYEAFEVSPFDPTVVDTVTAEDTYGIQLWLNTPVSGLRFGAAALSKTLSGGLEGIFRGVGEERTFEDFLLSIEGQFSRWVVRTEYRAFDPDIPSFLPTGNDIAFDFSAFYAQLGWLATEKFHIFGQYEWQHAEESSPDFISTFDYDRRIFYGLAVNYLLSPNVVLKAEHHEVEAKSSVFQPVFTPQGPRIGGPILAADGGSYSILSLSVSF